MYLYDIVNGKVVISKQFSPPMQDVIWGSKHHIPVELLDLPCPEQQKKQNIELY